MMAHYAGALNALLGDETPLFSADVLVRLGPDLQLQPRHLLVTRSRLIFVGTLPLGCEATLVWIKDITTTQPDRQEALHVLHLHGLRATITVATSSEADWQHLQALITLRSPDAHRA